MKKWCLFLVVLLTAGCVKEGLNLPAEWEGYDLLVLIQPPGPVHGEVNIVDIEGGSVIENILEDRTGVIPNDMMVIDSHLFILSSYDSALNVFEFPELQTSSVVKFPEGSNPWNMVYASGRIFATLLMSHQVGVVDEDTLELVKVINIPEISENILPYPLGIAEHRGRVYVSLSAHDSSFMNYGPGVYGVIDVDTMEYLKTITVPVDYCFDLQSIAFYGDSMIITCAGDWGWTQGGALVVLRDGDVIYSEELTAPIIPGSISVKEDRACIGSLMSGDFVLFDLKSYETSIHHVKDSGFVSSCIFYDSDRVIAGVWDISDRNNLFVFNLKTGNVEGMYQVGGPVQKVVELK